MTVLSMLNYQNIFFSALHSDNKLLHCRFLYRWIQRKFLTHIKCFKEDRVEQGSPSVRYWELLLGTGSCGGLPVWYTLLK